MSLHFSKMQGAGNDFVVLDCRMRPFALDVAQIQRMGDRHFGVGFDQLLTIEPARDPSCLFYYGIYNTDGSASAQCGNGARCVAAWLQRASVLNAGVARLESPSGPIDVEVLANGFVRIDMGEPRFAPDDLPMNLPAADLYTLPIADASVEFAAVSMGNPHVVIQVDEVQSAPLTTLGAELSTNAHFSQGCNVGFVQIIDRTHLKLRVWERGAGATLACGTGACAAVAALRRRGKVDAEVAVQLPGGTLTVRWDGPQHPLWMTGPAEFVYEGDYA